VRQRLIDQYHGPYNYPQLHEEEDGFTDPYSIFVYAIRSPHTKESYFDNIDFRPNITRTSNILPLSVVTGDKGYDSEDNHSLVRDGLHAFSIIPARYEYVPIWRTHGKYRKEMKLGYSKLLYNQRNKDETIISVIKRRFGEHLMSRLTRTQNRELSFRCITYNMHRLTNLIILMMFSTEPFRVF
jgi:DDE family transposase